MQKKPIICALGEIDEALRDDDLLFVCLDERQDQWLGQVIDADPDLILFTVDEKYIKNTLYLIACLAELGIPIALSVRCSSMASYDPLREVADVFNIALLNTQGPNTTFFGELKECIAHRKRPAYLKLGKLEEELEAFSDYILLSSEGKENIPLRWLCLGLLSGDEKAYAYMQSCKKGSEVIKASVGIKEDIERRLNLQLDSYVTSMRQKYVDTLTKGL